MKRSYKLRLLVPLIFVICICFILYFESNDTTEDLNSLVLKIGQDRDIAVLTASSILDNFIKQKQNKSRTIYFGDSAVLTITKDWKSLCNYSIASILLYSVYSNFRDSYNLFYKLDDIPPPFAIYI